MPLVLQAGQRGAAGPARSSLLHGAAERAAIEGFTGRALCY